MSGGKHRRSRTPLPPVGDARTVPVQPASAQWSGCRGVLSAVGGNNTAGRAQERVRVRATDDSRRSATHVSRGRSAMGSKDDADKGAQASICVS